MKEPRMIVWLFVGIILSVGVVALTVTEQLPPAVLAALAGVAINAIFEKRSNASLRKDYQQILAEYRSMMTDKR